MSFARTSLYISAGVIIWALHFALIYGVTALACARGWDGIVAPAIALASLVAVLATLVVIVVGWRRRAQFESWLAATVGALALVAIIYEAIPVLIVPTCG